MHGLMGIVFGCGIIYLLSKIVTIQRRISVVEEDRARMFDLNDTLRERVEAMEERSVQIDGVLKTINDQPKPPPSPAIMADAEEPDYDTCIMTPAPREVVQAPTVNDVKEVDVPLHDLPPKTGKGRKKQPQKREVPAESE